MNCVHLLKATDAKFKEWRQLNAYFRRKRKEVLITERASFEFYIRVDRYRELCDYVHHQYNQKIPFDVVDYINEFESYD